MDESYGSDHFGEALSVLQEAGDQVLRLVDRDGDDVDRPGEGVGSRKRCTDYGGPRGSFLRKKDAMEPEFGVDLVAFSSGSSE